LPFKTTGKVKTNNLQDAKQRTGILFLRIAINTRIVRYRPPRSKVVCGQWQITVFSLDSAVYSATFP
jgi:hypothetical protein